jgi:hypothetical protein
MMADDDDAFLEITSQPIWNGHPLELPLERPGLPTLPPAPTFPWTAALGRLGAVIALGVLVAVESATGAHTTAIAIAVAMGSWATMLSTLLINHHFDVRDYGSLLRAREATIEHWGLTRTRIQEDWARMGVEDGQRGEGT